MTAAAEAEGQRFTGKGGKGMVTVSMNGYYEVVEVQIDRKAVAARDPQLMARWVREAVNGASAAVTQAFTGNLDSVAGALGFDAEALKKIG